MYSALAAQLKILSGITIRRLKRALAENGRTIFDARHFDMISYYP